MIGLPVWRFSLTRPASSTENGIDEVLFILRKPDLARQTGLKSRDMAVALNIWLLFVPLLTSPYREIFQISTKYKNVMRARPITTMLLISWSSIRSCTRSKEYFLLWLLTTNKLNMGELHGLKRSGDDATESSSKRHNSDSNSTTNELTETTIALVDIKKIEYASRLLQKNIRIILADSPDVLELESAGGALKTELDHNVLIQLAARLKTKHKIGKLELFDKIIAADVQVSEKDWLRLAKLNGKQQSAVKVKEETLAPIVDEIGTCGVHGDMPPLPRIRDMLLYERVFVHKSTINSKSFYNESEMRNFHNERLEFLGDSVLNNLATQIIYTRFPNASEGDLTQIRSHLIDNKTLAKFSYAYGLNRKLRTHMSEDDLAACGQKIYADIFEAYIGAVATERDMDLMEVKEWLAILYEPKIRRFEEEMSDVPLNKEAKTELYLIVGTALFHPTYHVVQKGDGMDKMYIIECRMGLDVLGTGTASNQRDAGLRAAMHAAGNKPLLEKYHRNRLEMDRAESIKPSAKRLLTFKDDGLVAKRDGSTPQLERLSLSSLFPVKADIEEPLDVNARNQLYAQLGREIAVVPEYAVTTKGENEHEAQLLVQGILLATAIDSNKKRAMTRAAMALLNNKLAMDCLLAKSE